MTVERPDKTVLGNALEEIPEAISRVFLEAVSHGTDTEEEETETPDDAEDHMRYVALYVLPPAD
jgi:hypothetical protein